MPILQCFAVLSIASAQQLVSFSGDLFTDTGEPENTYVVELTNPASHIAVDRTTSSQSGRFEFSNVPGGSYTLVIRTEGGEILGFQDISSSASNGPTRIHITEPKKNKPVSGTVDAATLQHHAPKKAIQEMNAAIQAGKAGDSDKAQAHLLKALALDPDFSEAHTNLGAIYTRAGKIDLAYREFETALRLGPKGAMQYCNLAVAALAMNRVEEAEKEVRSALAIDSRNSQSNYLLAKILAPNPANYDEVVKRLKLAEPDIPKAKIALAQLYARAGRKDEAIAKLEEYQKSSPTPNKDQVEKMISSLR
jgi:tetratricopeptide (TPR) repeat protein